MRIRNSIVCFLAYCGLAFLIYYPIVATPFISDDWHWLWVAHERSAFLTDFLANTAGTRVGGSYNPLASLYINVIHWFFGLNPVPFHVGSILLHVFVACALASLMAVWLRVYGSSFYSARQRALISFAVGALFTVWPTLVEAVIWISSVPHLLATLFYCISVIYFLRWKEGKGAAALCISILAAATSFFSKESAISLPIILLVLDMGYELHHKRGLWNKQRLMPAWYFLIAAAFLCLRYTATGIGFGTYTDESFIIRATQMVNTFGTFWEEFLTAGILRVEWMRSFWHAPWVGSALLGVFVVLGIFVIRRMRAPGSGVAFAACCASIVPYLALGFSRTTVESERYTYLPLTFFIIMIALLGAAFASQKRGRPITLAMCGVLLAAALAGYARHKVFNWQAAGQVNEKIVSGATALIADHPGVKTWYAVGLPDTLNGAHVFRNNLSQALMLRGSLQGAELVYIPVYLALTHDTVNSNVILWRSDEKGLLGETRNDAYVVTGVDREVLPFVTYELWHYDYTTFTSDTIRLNFSDDVLTALREGTAAVLTWDNGAVRELRYQP